MSSACLDLQALPFLWHFHLSFSFPTKCLKLSSRQLSTWKTGIVFYHTSRGNVYQRTTKGLEVLSRATPCLSSRKTLPSEERENTDQLSSTSCSYQRVLSDKCDCEENISNWHNASARLLLLEQPHVQNTHPGRQAWREKLSEQLSLPWWKTLVQLSELFFFSIFPLITRKEYNFLDPCFPPPLPCLWSYSQKTYE